MLLECFFGIKTLPRDGYYISAGFVTALKDSIFESRGFLLTLAVTIHHYLSRVILLFKLVVVVVVVVVVVRGVGAYDALMICFVKP